MRRPSQVKPTSHLEAKAAQHKFASSKEIQEARALLHILDLGQADVAAGKTKSVVDIVARLRDKRSDK